MEPKAKPTNLANLPYRMTIIGKSGSGMTNTVMNLMKAIEDSKELKK